MGSYPSFSKQANTADTVESGTLAKGLQPLFQSKNVVDPKTLVKQEMSYYYSYIVEKQKLESEMQVQASRSDNFAPKARSTILLLQTPVKPRNKSNESRISRQLGSPELIEQSILNYRPKDYNSQMMTSWTSLNQQENQRMRYGTSSQVSRRSLSADFSTTKGFKKMSPGLSKIAHLEDQRRKSLLHSLNYSYDQDSLLSNFSSFTSSINQSKRDIVASTSIRDQNRMSQEKSILKNRFQLNLEKRNNRSSKSSEERKSLSFLSQNKFGESNTIIKGNQESKFTSQQISNSPERREDSEAAINPASSNLNVSHRKEDGKIIESSQSNTEMRSVPLQSLMKKVICPKNCKVRLEMNEVKLNPDLQVVCRSKTKLAVNQMYKQNPEQLEN